MSFFSGLSNNFNRRNRFNNAQNMRGGVPYRTVSQFMGGGIMGGMLPRKRMAPPSIAEAQGRNMANVGLLPEYMQPGGTGLPSDQSGGMRSDIMPRNPGYGFNMPKPRSPFQMAPLSMKGGGEAEKYPNEGIEALAKEAPEVVKKMGYEMGGLASYANGGPFSTYDVVMKLVGSELNNMEMRLFSEMKLNKNSAEEIARVIRESRGILAGGTSAGTSKLAQDLAKTIKKYDYAYKPIRVGPESGYKMDRGSRMIPQISQGVPQNTFKSRIKDLLKLGSKAPKFSLPSLMLGLGSGLALDYFFDDEDVPAPAMGPGRTISDRDRMLMERMAGRELSDQEIQMLIDELSSPIKNLSDD